jgi:hypothetical protein
MAKMKEIMKERSEDEEKVPQGMAQNKRRKVDEVEKKPLKRLQRQDEKEAVPDSNFDENNRYESGSEAEYQVGNFNDEAKN